MTGKRKGTKKCHRQKEEKEKNNGWFRPSGCLRAKSHCIGHLRRLPDIVLPQGKNGAG